MVGYLEQEKILQTVSILVFVELALDVRRKPAEGNTALFVSILTSRIK